jgi:uncharacterized membrane protein
MAKPHENLDERLLHRMLFFTDAVFAIVMTILVLELKPPRGDLTSDEIVRVANELIAFAMSFAIISVFWAAHMNTTRRLQHFDWAVAFVNLAFLFPVCLVPFVTAWGFMGGLAWGAYCGVMVAISATNVALTLVASRGGGRLEGGSRPRERVARVARGASPGLAFAVGLVLVLSGHLQWAYPCGALIPLFIWISARVFGPVGTPGTV